MLPNVAREVDTTKWDGVTALQASDIADGYADPDINLGMKCVSGWPRCGSGLQTDTLPAVEGHEISIAPMESRMRLDCSIIALAAWPISAPVSRGGDQDTDLSHSRQHISKPGRRGPRPAVSQL
jgi:hypothetical protein